jgi:tRNA pseudouridine38-40 synthase
MKRYAVRVFYEGKEYFGYQRQLDKKTTEGTIIQTLEDTGYISSPDKNNFRSASRTDKHVNALGNVFSFDSEKKIILEEINAALPKDKSIICWAYSEVDMDFSPKYSNWKRYWYMISKEFLEVNSSMTVNEIETVSSQFIGEHDFGLFCKRDHRKTIRTIDSLNVIEHDNSIILEFIANSFLWEQVRRITSYILNFNELAEKLQDTEALLKDQKEVQVLNIEPASPEQLILVEHFYEDIKWNTSKKTKEQLLKKLLKERLKIKQREVFFTSALDFFDSL